MDVKNQTLRLFRSLKRVRSFDLGILKPQIYQKENSMEEKQSEHKRYTLQNHL